MTTLAMLVEGPTYHDSEPIQVMIAYCAPGYTFRSRGVSLGAAYNRAMRRASSEWVLFLDQDIFICNDHWYYMCLEAIEQVGHDTGWISAVTNRIGNPAQRVEGAPESHDLVEHCAFAKELYEKHGNKVERCKGAMSGFWILTNKTAWLNSGGFEEEKKKFLGVDNYYSRALSQAGYKHYRIPGLYVYHMYQQKKFYMRW